MCARGLRHSTDNADRPHPDRRANRNSQLLYDYLVNAEHSKVDPGIAESRGGRPREEIVHVMTLADCQVLADDGLLVVDCETTGLDADSRTIQFGAVFLDLDGSLEGSYKTFLAADGWVGTSEAQAVHGISASDLADAPLFADAVLPLLRFFRKRRVIAHRASFDQGKLMYEFSLLGVEPTPDFFCSKILCATLGYGTLRLQEAAARFQINPGKPHDAGDDAMTVALLVRHFLNTHPKNTKEFLNIA